MPEVQTRFFPNIGNIYVDLSSPSPTSRSKWSALFNLAEEEGRICVIVDSKTAAAIYTAATKRKNLKVIRRKLPEWEASLDRFKNMDNPCRVWISKRNQSSA